MSWVAICNSNRAKFCAFLIERSLQQEFEVWIGSLVGGESGNRKYIDGTLDVPESGWGPAPWVRTGAVNSLPKRQDSPGHSCSLRGKKPRNLLQGCGTRVWCRRETGAGELETNGSHWKSL